MADHLDGSVKGTLANLLGVALLGTWGCAATPPPVTLAVEPAAAAVLAGRWEGEYRSTESGRSGSILFELNAAGDSAVGDVIMIPAGYDRAIRPARPDGDPSPRTPRESPEALRIAFVRAAAGRVSGALEPYRDAECGCLLRTAFVGTIRGDTISGTFESLHRQSGYVAAGVWRVQRTRRP